MFSSSSNERGDVNVPINTIVDDDDADNIMEMAPTKI